MERPQSIFGLARHLVAVRWQALSPRGRMFALAATVAAGLAVGSAAHCAMGGCAGSCPSRAMASDCPHHAPPSP